MHFLIGEPQGRVGGSCGLLVSFIFIFIFLFRQDIINIERARTPL